MDFVKKGTLMTKYVTEDCEFKKKSDFEYTLKSTTNPKFNKFVGQTLTVEKWDLISECDYTEGPEFNQAYNFLIQKIRSGNQRFNVEQADIILKKYEKVMFTGGGIDFSEPRAVRVTNSVHVGGGRRTGRNTALGVGTGKSVSQSKDVMTHVDRGRVTITNKRFIFSGAKKNINIDLKKITGIDLYTNGIKIHRSNKQKVEQFIGFENISFNFNMDGKKYYITFNGQVVKALIEGGLNSNDTKKVTTQKKSQPKKVAESPKESNDELLFKYAELYEKGLLTQDEFESKKKELLGL